MNVEKLFVSAFSRQDLSEEFGKAFDLHHKVGSLNAIHRNCLLQDNSKALTNNSDKEIEHEDDAKEESSCVDEEVGGRVYHIVILSTSHQVNLILSNIIVFDTAFCLSLYFLY